MNHYNPFDVILDSYQNECLKLYAIIQSLFDYPKLRIDDYDDGTENKLYATAFAYICSDYLVDFTSMTPNEDFSSVTDSMNFDENEKEIFKIADKLNILYNASKIKEQKETNISIENDVNENSEFNTLVFQIIVKYREKISTDIKLLFNTEKLQLRLFGSIFSMYLDDSYEPSFDLISSVPTTHFLH